MLSRFIFVIYRKGEVPSGTGRLASRAAPQTLSNASESGEEAVSNIGPAGTSVEFSEVVSL